MGALLAACMRGHMHTKCVPHVALPQVATATNTMRAAVVAMKSDMSLSVQQLMVTCSTGRRGPQPALASAAGHAHVTLVGLPM